MVRRWICGVVVVGIFIGFCLSSADLQGGELLYFIPEVQVARGLEVLHSTVRQTIEGLVKADPDLRALFDPESQLSFEVAILVLLGTLPAKIETLCQTDASMPEHLWIDDQGRLRGEAEAAAIMLQAYCSRFQFLQFLSQLSSSGLSYGSILPTLDEALAGRDLTLGSFTAHGSTEPIRIILAEYSQYFYVNAFVSETILYPSIEDQTLLQTLHELFGDPFWGADPCGELVQRVLEGATLELRLAAFRTLVTIQPYTNAESQEFQALAQSLHESFLVSPAPSCIEKVEGSLEELEKGAARGNLGAAVVLFKSAAEMVTQLIEVKQTVQDGESIPSPEDYLEAMIVSLGGTPQIDEHSQATNAVRQQLTNMVLRNAAVPGSLVNLALIDVMSNLGFDLSEAR